MKRYNFSAGPAKLPDEVLKKAQSELLNWHNLGASVMEVSHRSKEFEHCIEMATENLKQLLSIPDNYKILFLQGGARTQFATIPMNLVEKNQTACYFDSGYWSQSAADEASKYCHVINQNIITNDNGKRAVTSMKNWQIDENAQYLHYCPNETLDGLAIREEPNFCHLPVVADFSSCLLAGPIDVSRYGLIYAGAQKNMGPSGVTVVIVRNDLIGKGQSLLPSVYNYAIQYQKDSMYNTPPTFAIYLAGLVFEWLMAQGGLSAIFERNKQKADELYHFIDQSALFNNNIAEQNRSLMNVSFSTGNQELDTKCVAEAIQNEIIGIKGHSLVGGMRASIYNAMDIVGVRYLINFLAEFERKHKR